MNRMTDVRSVAANTTVDNVISGKIHEFLTQPSRVRLAIQGSAAGLRCSLLVGGESFIQDQEIGSANRFPLLPDDIAGEAAGFKGDRVVLQIRNTTAGALTAQSAVDVIPV